MNWLSSFLRRLARPLVVPSDPDPRVDYADTEKYRHEQNGVLADIWQRKLEERARSLEAQDDDLVNEADMIASQMADEKQRDILQRRSDNRLHTNPH